MFQPTEIKQSSFVSVPDAERLALLNGQLRYAAARSAYYAETLAGLHPLPALDSLTALPFTDAATLQREGRRLVCVPAGEIARIVSLSTSGSTGAAKRLYFTENDLARTVDFFAEGMSWLCAPGDVCAVLMPCAAPDGIGALLSRALRAIGVRPLPIGLPEDLAAVRETLLREQPQALVGFPWHLRLLALLCPTLRPRVVLLSGDYIPAGVRSLLASLWQTTVTTHFGMTETGYGGAVQHPSGGVMHLRRDELIAEVVDPETGAPLPAGCAGELVLTTLRREAMPLLRYRTGDRAVLSPEGDLAGTDGRLNVPPQFYRLQDTLSVLPWLWDYRGKDGCLRAFLTPDAPDDAATLLEAMSGLRVTCRTVSPEEVSLLDRGKRSF